MGKATNNTTGKENRTMETFRITLTIDEVYAAGSVEQALLKWCEDSADFLGGSMGGPTFATSGPGTGVAREFDITDFAWRAHQDGGHYLDVSDGRASMLEDDGPEDGPEGIVWTESIVDAICPSACEAVQMPDACAQMADAVASVLAGRSDLVAWRTLLGDIRRASDALEGTELDEYDDEE